MGLAEKKEGSKQKQEGNGLDVGNDYHQRTYESICEQKHHYET